MHWCLQELEALVGGVSKPFSSYFFWHSFFSHAPCLSLASPILPVYERTGDEVFLEEMWEMVCNPFPIWCGLHSPEENNNAHTLPAQLDSSPTHWCLESYCITLWGDSTRGTGQGLGDQWSIPFHSWKNIPSGNNLAFPAKHELVWQPDKLITPVHLIPRAWLITITRPRTQWIQPP